MQGFATFAFLLAFTACPHSVPELTSPADPNASTPIETLQFEDENLREAVLESAEEGGWEYSQDIEWVHAPGRNIESLEGIQFLFSLDELNVPNNSITSIVPLESFDELSRVDISNNDITTLESLSGMSVSSLIIGRIPIETLSPIAEVSDLEDLRMYDLAVSVDEFYSLADSVNGWNDLRHLSIGSDEDFSIDLDMLNITSMSSIRVLRLNFDEIENINSIRGLTELAHVGFRGASLSQAEHSGLFENLNSLGTIQLYDVEADNDTLGSLGIAGAGDLDELSVWSDDITNASFAAGLESVQWLDLGGDSLTSLDGLDEVGDINVLMASNNPELSDISALRGHSLRELNLRDTPLGDDDVSDIVAAMAEDAWQVSLSNTEITNVGELGELNSASLDLAGVQIESGLSDLTNLDDPNFIDLHDTGVEESLPDELEDLIERFGEDVVRY